MKINPQQDLVSHSLSAQIDNSKGFFGEFGGAFVPEVLLSNLRELEECFDALWKEDAFHEELALVQKELSGRPTAFTPLRRLTEKLGGAQLYIKNEGLAHTGAHKVNHCLGQIIVAAKLGRKRIIAETGAGQHGIATATVSARYGLPCTIYMGYKDYQRQRPNVCWMEMLGAKVIPVHDGDQTLNSAVIAAMKDLMSNPKDSHYLIGTVVGPHPYPKMNTLFQRIIGKEIKQQALETFGKLPDVLVSCVGGGSNAMGMFYEFLDDKEVRLIGVEAGGKGTASGQHAARFLAPKKGIFEGYYSYFLQDGDGNIATTHSISAGLDYCGVSPILAWLHDVHRVEFAYAQDQLVLEHYQTLMRTEGLIPAMESAHGIAYGIELAKTMRPDQHIVLNMSGRGEKDLFIVMENFQPEELEVFLENKLHQLRALQVPA